MNSTINNCFLNYIDNKKGERLIQGILLFLLRHDTEFNQAFCNWIDIKLLSDVQEEVQEGIHRHDLVLDCDEDKKIRIELKFWADWTSCQSEDPDAIDLVIVPEIRLEEATEKFRFVKTWEDMEEKVVKSSPLANILLSALDQYYSKSGYLQDRPELEEVLRDIYKSFESGGDFLYKFASKINFNDLTTGNMTTSLRGWKGFFIKNPHLSDDWSNYLWFGVNIDLNKWNQDKRLDYSLILQICSKELASKFSNLEVLTDSADFVGHNEGIIVKPDSKGKYFLKGTLEQCKDLITQYSLLNSEGGSLKDKEDLQKRVEYPMDQIGEEEFKCRVKEAHKMTEKQIQDFIDQREWIFAKTMPQCPHYYTLKKGEKDEVFLEFVRHIFENGYERKWYNSYHTYFDFGEWYYWTMDDTIEETDLINRAKLSERYRYEDSEGNPL